MASAPEQRGIIGVPVGTLDQPTAAKICQMLSDYIGECAAIWLNEEMQRYEVHVPVGDVTRQGLVCYCTGLSYGENTDSDEEVNHIGAIETMSRIQQTMSRQDDARTANGEQFCAPTRTAQRPRAIRDRRRNPTHVRGHIPRPRNSWIIYRSDKTRELRDMDPSLTASDISRITSRLWAEELPHVKVQYQQRAQEESNAHMAMYPDYRYRARRPIPRHPTVDSMMFMANTQDVDEDYVQQS